MEISATMVCIGCGVIQNQPTPELVQFSFSPPEKVPAVGQFGNPVVMVARRGAFTPGELYDLTMELKPHSELVVVQNGKLD